MRGIRTGGLTPFADCSALDEAGLRGGVYRWIGDLGIQGPFIAGNHEPVGFVRQTTWQLTCEGDRHRTC